MNNDFLGLSSAQFNTLILILLLIITGLVSFHYYAFISTANGLSIGSAVGVNILGKNNR